MFNAASITKDDQRQSLYVVPVKALAAAAQNALYLAVSGNDAARMLATNSLGMWKEKGQWVCWLQRNRASKQVLEVIRHNNCAVVFRFKQSLVA